MWATPLAHDSAQGNPDRVGRFGTAAGGKNLTDEAVLWAAVVAQQFEAADLDRMLERQARQAAKNGNNGFGLTLPNFVEHGSHSARQAPTTPDGPPSSPPRRSLNPRFVEWLMRWPIGWTDFGCAETASIRWRRDMRGLLWTLCTARRAAESGQGMLL